MPSRNVSFFVWVFNITQLLWMDESFKQFACIFRVVNIVSKYWWSSCDWTIRFWLPWGHGGFGWQNDIIFTLVLCIILKHLFSEWLHSTAHCLQKEPYQGGGAAAEVWCLHWCNHWGELKTRMGLNKPLNTAVVFNRSVNTVCVCVTTILPSEVRRQRWCSTYVSSRPACPFVVDRISMEIS